VSAHDGDRTLPTAPAPTLTTAPAEGPRHWWRSIPRHLGRARTSTVVLAVLFVAIGLLYLYVRPETTDTAPAGDTEVVPVAPATTAAPEPTTTPSGSARPTTTAPSTTGTQEETEPSEDEETATSEPSDTSSTPSASRTPTTSPSSTSGSSSSPPA
jgi:hypothetical protein